MRIFAKLQKNIQKWQSLEMSGTIKKEFLRTFKISDMLLLEVKDFLHKTKKFAKICKGPYIITRDSENN